MRKKFYGDCLHTSAGNWICAVARSINKRFYSPNALSVAAEGDAVVRSYISAGDKLSAYTRFELYVSLRTLRKHSLRACSCAQLTVYYWNTAMFDLARNVARG